VMTDTPPASSICIIIDVPDRGKPDTTVKNFVSFASILDSLYQPDDLGYVAFHICEPIRGFPDESGPQAWPLSRRWPDRLGGARCAVAGTNPCDVREILFVGGLV
jgi:hypothetical protein